MQEALAVLQEGGEKEVRDTKCDLECAAAGIATYFTCAATCAKTLPPDKAVICLTVTCPPAVAAATEACLKENPDCKDGRPGAELQSLLEQYLRQPAWQTAIHREEGGRTDVFLPRNEEENAIALLNKEHHIPVSENPMQEAPAVLQEGG